jgi:hypothetical protein
MRGEAGLRGTNERILVSDKADAVRKTKCTLCNTCFICMYMYEVLHAEAREILHTQVQTERIIPERARSSPA